MKTVTFDDSEVTTLRQIAEELAKLYGWVTFDVNARAGVIAFTSADARLFNLKPTGFAYEVKDGVEAEAADEDNSVDFRDDLDYCYLAWGRDEDGELVAVHG